MAAVKCFTETQSQNEMQNPSDRQYTFTDAIYTADHTTICFIMTKTSYCLLLITNLLQLSKVAFTLTQVMSPSTGIRVIVNT